MKGGSRKGGGRSKELVEYKKGLWTAEEDKLLLEYVKVHGKGKWNRIPHLTGLKRCGKSCRLRWMNYLNPNIKHGDFSPEEDDLIIRLHKLLGNRWSLIAGRVPGRTDNQVKNHWNTNLSKKINIKKGKSKIIRASASSPQRSLDKVGANSNIMALADNSGRGHVEKLMGIEDVTKSSSVEEPSKGELLSIEDRHAQSPLLFFSEDDNLFFDTQSLMDLLSEYSLDHTWNTKL